MIKRTFDLVGASLGLVILSPLMLTIALLIKADAPGPVLFRQERIGRRFRPFVIYKFRSMSCDAATKGGNITSRNDPRITRVGRILRRSKLDELPQLLNVLKGDMSFVGPRPEVRRYVELFQEEYQEILTVRPGITDLASLEYQDESSLLDEGEQGGRDYVEKILPHKIQLSKQYIRHASLWLDLKVITKTVMRVAGFSITSIRI